MVAVLSLFLGGEFDKYEDWQYSQKLHELWVLSIGNIPHVLGKFGSRDWFGRRSRLRNCRTLCLPARWCNLDESAALQWLGSEVKGNPFQTAKKCQKKRGVAVLELGSNYCVHTRGKKASRSQRVTERVHDIKRVSSCSEVLARMEIWKAALKEHVKDAGCEVGITMTMRQETHVTMMSPI